MQRIPDGSGTVTMSSRVTNEFMAASKEAVRHRLAHKHLDGGYRSGKHTNAFQMPSKCLPNAFQMPSKFQGQTIVSLEVRTVGEHHHSDQLPNSKGSHPASLQILRLVLFLVLKVRGRKAGSCARSTTHLREFGFHLGHVSNHPSTKRAPRIRAAPAFASVRTRNRCADVLLLPFNEDVLCNAGGHREFYSSSPSPRLPKLVKEPWPRRTSKCTYAKS